MVPGSAQSINSVMEGDKSSSLDGGGITDCPLACAPFAGSEEEGADGGVGLANGVEV